MRQDTKMTQEEITRTIKYVLLQQMSAAPQTKEHEEDKTYRDKAGEK